MNWDDFLRPETAGTVGGLLGWLNAPGGTVKEQAFNLLSGIAAAIFLAPYLAERAGMASQTGRMAFAFVIGLVGMNLLAKLIAAAKKTDWAALLPKGTKQ